MWQYEPELDQMGTPDALMLLPYWTNGCIGSQEGLYYESSATTPYHFINAAELSDQPSNPVRGLNYPSAPDVAEGVQHLQMLGVKYFMAETPDVIRPRPTPTATCAWSTPSAVPGRPTRPAPPSAVQQRTWKIYEVLDSELVTPLVDQPVVMNGRVQGRQALARRLPVLVPRPQPVGRLRSRVGTQGLGPSRATAHRPCPTTPLPLVQVTDIHEGTQSISFNVDQTGVPVLVKTSYFPNWSVSGGRGVYRVTPNLMVVIPTANHVTARLRLHPDRLDRVPAFPARAGRGGPPLAAATRSSTRPPGTSWRQPSGARPRDR